MQIAYTDRNSAPCVFVSLYLRVFSDIKNPLEQQQQLCNTWLLPMRVFQFGDDGGVEIVDSRSRACGRTVHHVNASLVLATHPFSTQGCLAKIWGHVQP